MADHEHWTFEQWVAYFRSLGMAEDRAREAAAVSARGHGCLAD